MHNVQKRRPCTGGGMSAVSKMIGGKWLGEKMSVPSGDTAGRSLDAPSIFQSVSWKTGLWTAADALNCISFDRRRARFVILCMHACVHACLHAYPPHQPM